MVKYYGYIKQGYQDNARLHVTCLLSCVTRYNVTINILRYLHIYLCFFFNNTSTSTIDQQPIDYIQLHTTPVVVEFGNNMNFSLFGGRIKSVQFPDSLFDIFNGQYKVSIVELWAEAWHTSMSQFRVLHV